MSNTVKQQTRNEYLMSIKNGQDPQFVFNAKAEQVECKCGRKAVWLREGYLCSSITAYPCKY